MSKIEHDALLDAKIEQLASVEIVRDDSESIQIGADKKVGKIIEYRYKILVHEKPAIEGTLTREEVDLMHRLYTYEGSNLTQRSVSRYFPNFTFQDFKKILRAFNITKSSSPIAQHIIEEKPKEELALLTFQNKENDYLRYIEQNRARITENKLKEMTGKYYDLKQQIANFDEIITKSITIEPYKKVGKKIKTKQNLVLHLSDLHIGAKVRKTSIYKNEYNYDVVKKRLSSVLERISDKKYDTIIVNILGDNLDGMDQQTARRDHILPQNMDNFEQVTAFLEIMEWFFVSLNELGICNNIKVYSVKDGNHDGITAYVTTMALFAKLKVIIPNCETKLFSDFFGYYEFEGHKFIICHGKDDEFMKRGLPLNIGDKEKIMIYNWLESQNIYGNNIHFVKGDLHSDNLNSSYKLDYRNCLSLFGASDYASFNFERNHYGVSYSIIDNGNILNGTFVDL